MADNPEDDFLDSSKSKVDLGDAAYTSAAFGSMFAPGAGVADVMGYAPDPFNPGQLSPSFSENVEAGRYVDAGLQTLGLAGDALYAAAPFTAGITALPAAAAKGVQAMAKSVRAIKPVKAEDLGVLGNKNPDTGEFIPHVFYHGTTDSFEDFKVGPSGAVYVSETPGYAEEYAGFTPEIKSERYPELNRELSAREGSNIRPVYIKDNLNFFDERNSDHLAVLERSGFDLDEIPRNYPNPYDETFRELMQAGEWDVMEEIAPAIKEAGFDGYRTVEGGNYSLAIFDPNNLVSATAKKQASLKSTGLLGGDKPQRFYHGSKTGFKEFDPDAEVTFVADRPSTAEYYAENRDIYGRFPSDAEGANIRPVYLKDVNFFDVDNPEHIKQLRESDWYKSKKAELDDGFTYPEEGDFVDVVEAGEYDAIEKSGLVDWIKSQGFDGFTTYEQDGKNYGVFNVENIVPGVAKKAEGGVVSLLDRAQNMTRGPKGVASLSSIARNMNRPMVS